MNMQIVIRTPEEAHQTFATAVNSGDVEQVLALYEENARLALPGEAVVGHDAMRPRIYQDLIAPQGTMRLETKSISQVEGLALLRSTWTYTVINLAGKPDESSGESVEILRRQPDGTWRYVIELPLGEK